MLDYLIDRLRLYYGYRQRKASIKRDRFRLDEKFLIRTSREVLFAFFGLEFLFCFVSFVLEAGEQRDLFDIIGFRQCDHAVPWCNFILSDVP